MPTEGGLKLRSDTERDTYNSLKYTSSGAKVAGALVKINDTVGVWANDTATNVENVLIYQASKLLVPCVAITTGNLADFDEGSKVYYDVADAEVNATASGNTLCGIVVEQPAIGDEEVLIHLDGMLGIVA